MLLETLDIKKNDILIYSQNVFDLENNFKIIYKDDPDKNPRKISYGEVCKFINEYTPKNLIIYRMLTNIPDFEIFLSKYGFFININGVTELIYFDPVFAVKELEEYSASLNYDLRFRIQQVGLTTLNRFKNLPNYAEIYSVDLQAIEAKNQNDKVFADAIFSVERETKNKKMIVVQQPLRKNTEKNTVLKKETKIAPADNIQKQAPVPGEYVHEIKKALPQVKPRPQESPKAPSDINLIHHDLSEDKDFDYRQIMKISFKGATSEMVRRTTAKMKIENPQPAPSKNASDSSFGKFLHGKQLNEGASTEHLSLGDIPKDHLSDMFKSPSSLKNLADGKENPKVVLRLNKR